jgi:hypothetical protein
MLANRVAIVASASGGGIAAAVAVAFVQAWHEMKRACCDWPGS